MLANTKATSKVSVGVACAYTVGFLVAYAISGGYMSCVIVMAAIAQCLGIVFLCIQVSSSKVATGISAKAIALDGFSIACRLSNTLWLNAYIPFDSSGDYLFQAVELLSVALIMWLLHMVLVTYRDTYQAEEDTVNVKVIISVCFVLAAIFHTDLADRPVFDTIWMTGLLTGAVAVLPQLSLICKRDGRVQAFTSHYLFALALSRALNGIMFWIGRDELTCEPWIEGVEHGKWAILVALAVQNLLVSDFSYHYVKSAMCHGFQQALALPSSIGWGEDWNKARWV